MIDNGNLFHTVPIRGNDAPPLPHLTGDNGHARTSERQAIGVFQCLIALVVSLFVFGSVVTLAAAGVAYLSFVARHFDLPGPFYLFLLVLGFIPAWFSAVAVGRSIIRSAWNVIGARDKKRTLG